MKKLLLLCMRLCLSLSEFPVWAQKENKRPRDVIFLLGKSNGNDEIIGIFYETQLQHFQDPRAPRFLLLDQKRKVALGIGGYVKMTVSNVLSYTHLRATETVLDILCRLLLEKKKKLHT